MHQIYSCHEENLEVFTVISSKMGISKQQSFNYNNNPSDAKPSQPQAAPVSHPNAKWTEFATTGAVMMDDVFAENCSSGRLPQQYTEDPTQGAEASLPLTGSSFYGTPSLSRNIWMKHKKKSEYLGATNSAFEAD